MENSIARVCTNEIETRKLHTNLYIQTGIQKINISKMHL